MRTTLCNLWLALLEICDVPVEKFGNCNGRIEDLLA